MFSLTREQAARLGPLIRKFHRDLAARRKLEALIDERIAAYFQRNGEPRNGPDQPRPDLANV